VDDLPDDRLEAVGVPELRRSRERVVVARGVRPEVDEESQLGQLLRVERGGVQPLVDELVQGTTALADVAITDAVRARGIAAKIDQARSERTQAAASFDAGRVTEGIDHLDKAWDRAEEAMRRLWR
jgi:hypothetical protein